MYGGCVEGKHDPAPEHNAAMKREWAQHADDMYKVMKKQTIVFPQGLGKSILFADDRCNITAKEHAKSRLHRGGENKMFVIIDEMAKYNEIDAKKMVDRFRELYPELTRAIKDVKRTGPSHRQRLLLLT